MKLADAGIREYLTLALAAFAVLFACDKPARAICDVGPAVQENKKEVLAPAGPDGVYRDRLGNGMSVLLYPSDTADRVALVMLYTIGEDHDPARKSGLSHLTEHLYVTAAAGETPARTARDFLQKYPNAWNASTGSDHSVFATVFGRDQVEAELKEAAARMGRLRVTEADLNREKPRLLEEVGNMFGAFPQLAVVNHARERVRPLGDGHRKGGLPAHVQRITLEDVKDWWSRHYKPVNATLVLAGAIDPKEARKLIARHFGAIRGGEKPPAPRKPGPPKSGPVENVPINSIMPGVQAQACIAFRAPEPGSKHYAPCVLAINRMWMRSAMGGRSVRVTFNLLDDPTFIAVSTAVKPDESPKAAVGRLRSFVDQATGATLESVEKTATKNNIGVMLGAADFPDLMIQQNLYGVAFSLGRREQLGFDSKKFAERLDGLTSEDLRAAARAVFAPERQAAVVVTPGTP